MITLVGERLNSVGQDFRFFFCDAAGEMGVRSAWNIPENPFAPIKRPFGLTCGPVFVAAPHPPPRTYELQGLGAAQRYARIERAMLRLDPRSRDILRGAYADDRPLLVREVFGECALLAEQTHAAEKAHHRARSEAPVYEWLDRLCQRVSRARRAAKPGTTGDWAVVEEIRVDATRVLVRAEREYLRVKGVHSGR